MKFSNFKFSLDDDYFNRSERHLSFGDVKERIIKFIKRDPVASYKLAIGTDSQVKGGYTVFASAIVVHRVKKGAWGCIKKNILDREVMNLREKISIETNLTLQLASKFTPDFFDEITEIILPYVDKGANFSHEVHIDIGKKGETKRFTKEMVGYFAGLDFEAKIKPESYAATSYANKYTK
ncbi:ribonuclease H-like YkuK family protein [Thermohalobacter berrensis]|uniref:Uncharacterized protein n=1 Tax=Thermohalobacter berrensis TaxID=99594 RepID=A0A419T8L3_9FIRM|nr:ribonuclease H-like YkuK family protein [Thermohalobacter berrensis]RKD33738.1 hypothetical protein BET03_08415 [Thermohalobacter berrensis]